MITTNTRIDLSGISEPPELTQIANIDLWALTQTSGHSQFRIVGTRNELSVWVQYVADLLNETEAHDG